MQHYIASADAREIEIAKDYGIHGILTNPTVMAKAGKPWRKALEDCVKLCGPIHVQVTEDDRDGIIRQALEFKEIVGDQLVVKIMISREGLAAAQILKEQGFLVNITGLVSGIQAAVAVQAGVDFVSVYIGRAENAGIDGLHMVSDVVRFIQAQSYPTRLVAASVNTPFQLYQAGLAGSHIAAVPLQVLQQSITHPVTDLSIIYFKKDWQYL